jgi:predicted nucleotidyltransferase
MRVIRRSARAIAEEFHPDKIILFGSYTYGTPHEHSDVDLLVVMPVRDVHAQEVRILLRLEPPFPLDLLVKTPNDMAWRLEEGESFTTTIVSQGKVLYEKDHKSGSKRRREITSLPGIRPEARFTNASKKRRASRRKPNVLRCSTRRAYASTLAFSSGCSSHEPL